MTSKNTKIETYDATLRDGMQGEGMSLTAAEKVRVVRKLDELGVDLIEAGFPASNPKELELFELLAKEDLQHAQVAAFGMTRRRDVAAADDPALQILADCFAPVCTIVGKTWRLHLDKVVRVSAEDNLELIRDSVQFLVGAGKRVIYDAEHFFDGYRDDPEYSVACLRAAAVAGAERVDREVVAAVAISGDVVLAQHHDTAAIFLSPQHFGRGKTRGAAADDDDLVRRSHGSCAARCGLLALLPDDDAIALVLHPPDRERGERRRARSLPGPQIEAGMMPGAADAVADDKAVGERPVIMTAMRVDGEDLGAGTYQQHLLIADMAEQRLAGEFA